VRVSLIGPLPPELGGATPGGVATHQAHLTAGLGACADLEVALLATNVRAASPSVSTDRYAERPYASMGVHVPRRPMDWLTPDYLRRVGAARLVRYAYRLARMPQPGSRKEVLGQLLWYRYFLEATRPDVVHVQHPLERAFYVQQVQRLERRKWPLVITAHSFFGEHDEYTIHSLMAPNLRAADRVIAVSPHIADQAASLGVDRTRIRVIRSGIDVERFQPRDRAAARAILDVDGATALILFVGNLEPRKQLDVLLRALPNLPDARLAIVGSGDSAGVDDQTHALQHLAQQLGLGTRVRFVGRVDGTTLLHWYAAADVFALPSSSEAQGIVALEAMASGLPVVASAVGGLLGTIEDGQTGYLVEPGEVEPLAQRLGALLADTPRRAAMGDAARQKVARDFTWQAAVASTVEVYRELAECQR
jgi:glycosyltransferase involved in cell wall biosynthesis